MDLGVTAECVNRVRGTSYYAQGHLSIQCVTMLIHCSSKGRADSPTKDSLQASYLQLDEIGVEIQIM